MLLGVKGNCGPFLILFRDRLRTWTFDTNASRQTSPHRYRGAEKTEAKQDLVRFQARSNPVCSPPTNAAEQGELYTASAHRTRLVPGATGSA
jgi:hypothetical protein